MSYYADRVLEATFSTGTGNLLLQGAPQAYVTWFLAFGVGVARPYVIDQPGTGNWEIGMGTVVDNGDGTYALSRAVSKSSNADALVSFPGGTKYVRATLPAADVDLYRAGAIASVNAIQKDGSVAFTGDQSLDGHALTNVSAINKMAITQPATGSTLAVADGKTLTANRTVTFGGTDGKTLNINKNLTLDGVDGKTLSLNKSLTLDGADGKMLSVMNSIGLAGTDGSTLNVGAGGSLAALAFKSSVDLSSADAAGTLAAARFPALTGDVTNTAGALATTIANNVVTYAKLQQVAASSLLANPTGSPANAQEVTLGTSLQFVSTALNTIQGIRTSDTPQFSRLGVGIASTTTEGVKAYTSTSGGAVQNGFSGVNTFDSSCTTLGVGLQFAGATQAASFTLGTAACVSAGDWAKGAGSAITTLVGYNAAALTAGGTSNLGFRGLVASTANGAFNCYMSGSAPNYFNGAIQTHTGTALGKADIRATSGAQIVASYDASNSMAETVSSTGLCTWTGTGTGKGHVFTDGVQAGTGASRAKLGGTLKTIVSAANNGTTVETDLHSVTVAANTLTNDGDSLEVLMDFSIVNNANNKTIKFYVDGGSPVFSSGAAAIAGQGAMLRATIKRISSTSTLTTLEFLPMTGSAWTAVYAQQSKSVTWSGSIVIKATGQSSASSNEVTQLSTIVKYNPANP